MNQKRMNQEQKQQAAEQTQQRTEDKKKRQETRAQFAEMMGQVQELNALGELTFGKWVRSLLHLPTFPVWAWHDPAPSVCTYIRDRARSDMKRALKKILRGGRRSKSEENSTAGTPAPQD